MIGLTLFVGVVIANYSENKVRRTRCFCVQWKWDENQVFQCTVKVRWEPGVSVYSENEMRTRCFSVQWKWDENLVLQCTVTVKMRWEPGVSVYSEKLFSMHRKDKMKAIIGGSCHNIIFVVTKVLAWQTHVCHDKRCVLSWQTCVCHDKKYACHDKIVVTTICHDKSFVFCGDKHTFSWQNFCHDKCTFVVTKDVFWCDKHVFEKKVKTRCFRVQRKQNKRLLG